MTMGKIVGLDVGDVRIGIAVCDEMRLIASPHSVYRRVGFGPDVKHIKALCDQLGTRDIVCGLPRNHGRLHRLPGAKGASPGRAAGQRRAEHRLSG